MTSQISTIEAAVVNEWMISSTYTADDIVSIIRGASTKSRPAIGPRQQLRFQSANAVDSADIIGVDNLQSQVIIKKYSYILIQGKYLLAQEIMTYLRVIQTGDSSYLYWS
jgi:hypothetical protein